MKILYLLFYFLIQSSLAEVEFLLAVWRHGDRAPEKLPYPSDPYNSTFWPRGWNQLTNVGIEQSVKLGKFLRRRYQNSVLSIFNRKKIQIRASDADRAIETAQCVATSLFPPDGWQLWNEGRYRYWQPIPIRTNGKQDPMLRPSKIKCPLYQNLVANNRKSIETEINKKYQKELETISNLTGHYTRYGNIKDVYNVMLEHYNGLPFPSWVNVRVNGRRLLDTVIEIRRIARLQLFDSREKSKFMAGFLINNWAENVINATEEKSLSKALLFSSHDGTLSSLLYGLNISNHQLVPYTACVMLEVHTGNFIKIFLRNTTTEHPDDVHQLLIPGCPSNCPVNQFLDLISDIRVRSIEELTEICNSSILRILWAQPFILFFIILFRM